MAADPAAPTGADAHARLGVADAAGRREIILRLILEHPEGRLELPALDGTAARLEGIDLSQHTLQAQAGASAGPLPWWDAEKQTLNLRHADLRGASLRRANLQGAILEGANASEADLAGANLRGAFLAGASLRGAMLEETDLQDATLRFAVLEDAALEGARLRGADLHGVLARGAVLEGADLQGAVLEEADFQEADLRGADLRGAVLKRVNLRGANLEGADLQGAALGGANLHGAILREARLQELALTSCDLTHVHTSDAWLERTRFHLGQLGGAIGEELAGEHELARRGYLALERNFEALGDPDAAGWAYGKKRRMQKRDALRRAQVASAAGNWREAAGCYLRYGLDQLVEWLCDYGESIPRVLGSLLAVYFLFTLLYGLTASVVHVAETPTGKTATVTHDLGELAIFSLTAVAMPGNPPEWLQPRNELGIVLSSLQALVCIFLTGLLGFVAGNRIRR